MNLFRLELRKKWKPTHDYLVKLQWTTFSCQWICEWTYKCCTPVVVVCVFLTEWQRYVSTWCLVIDTSWLQLIVCPFCDVLFLCLCSIVPVTAVWSLWKDREPCIWICGSPVVWELANLSGSCWNGSQRQLSSGTCPIFSQCLLLLDIDPRAPGSISSAWNF
jgi:hypothetical protein